MFPCLSKTLKLNWRNTFYQITEVWSVLSISPSMKSGNNDWQFSYSGIYPPTYKPFQFLIKRKICFKMCANPWTKKVRINHPHILFSFKQNQIELMHISTRIINGNITMSPQIQVNALSERVSANPACLVAWGLESNCQIQQRSWWGSCGRGKETFL